MARIASPCGHIHIKILFFLFPVIPLSLSVCTDFSTQVVRRKMSYICPGILALYFGSKIDSFFAGSKKVYIVVYLSMEKREAVKVQKLNKNHSRKRGALKQLPTRRPEIEWG